MSAAQCTKYSSRDKITGRGRWYFRIPKHATLQRSNGMSESHSTARIEYRPIPGFAGYRATSDGFVECCLSRGGRVVGPWKRVKSRIQNGTGRLIATVCYGEPGDRRQVTRQVSRLVCAAFHGECPDGMECCHNDGNRTNNTSDNLRWDTRAENFRDRDRHGTTARGMRGGRAKLTDDDVLAIRREWPGKSSRALAAQFGVNKALVLRIAHGQLWKHLPMPAQQRQPVTPTRT